VTTGELCAFCKLADVVRRRRGGSSGPTDAPGSGVPADLPMAAHDVESNRRSVTDVTPEDT
jgi:hypothetical protein